MPQPIKQSRIYDKRRPEGEQQIALLLAVSDPGVPPQILFYCQQYEDGPMFLDKQHAVEFASCLLMMALGLPGELPAGDCGISDDARAQEGR